MFAQLPSTRLTGALNPPVFWVRSFVIRAMSRLSGTGETPLRVD